MFGQNTQSSASSSNFLQNSEPSPAAVFTQKTEKAGKKNAKQEDAAKRFYKLNLYNVYFSEKFKIFKAQNPSMELKDLTKIISEDYKKMTDEERIKYTKI